jgi:hypothetical protein
VPAASRVKMNKKAKRAAATAAMVRSIDEVKPEASGGSKPGSRPASTSPGIATPGGPVKMIGKMTMEERKKRIAKYMDKRTRRRWGRKVEYECRKKLAVQRVRVNGRFA